MSMSANMDKSDFTKSRYIRNLIYAVPERTFDMIFSFCNGICVKLAVVIAQYRSFTLDNFGRFAVVPVVRTPDRNVYLLLSSYYKVLEMSVIFF